MLVLPSPPNEEILSKAQEGCLFYQPNEEILSKAQEGCLFYLLRNADLITFPFCYHTEAELVEAGADYRRKSACRPTLRQAQGSLTFFEMEKLLNSDS
ncbi:MAG: hypothetical protein ACPGWR_07225 [Ardenticatenaceae bacterium]